MRKSRALGLVIGALCAVSPAAFAQDISDKSVEAFMDYAWSMTPAKFTKPSGTVVEVNKKEREKVVVPVDTAREVIRAGRMTAHAQMCELSDLQVLNYRSLMKREIDKKKWSEQQMIYINQLHLTTVMLLTGKIQLIEQEGGGKQPVVEDTRGETKSCSEEQRKKVKEIIDAYLKAGPPVSLDPPPAPTASGPAQSPSGAMPAAASMPAAVPPAKKP